MTKNEALRRVVDELERVQGIHRQQASPHEGFAIIYEELDELWDEVKADASIDRMADEAVQVASSAIKFLIDNC